MKPFIRSRPPTIAILALALTLNVAVIAATPPVTTAPAGSAAPYVDAELMSGLEAFQQQMRAMQQAQASQQAPGQAQRAPPAMMQMTMPAGVVKRTIPGPGGAPEVAVYIVNADASRARRPAILHIHGGGYTGGSVAFAMRPLIPLAQRLDCVVVSVEYRLAPGTKFPGSLEDNYAALSWLFHHAAKLGVDPQRIAVMGESAGGGHAAMLALAARDRGEVPVKYQVLIYPMLDDRTGSTQPAPAHIGTIVWTAESNRAGWSALLGVPAGSTHVPAGAVPARVAKLAGLPPAFIAVGGIDLFVNEDIAYAQRLNNAGVPVELHVYPGAYHGFDIFAPDSTTSKAFQSELATALARAFKAQP